MNGGQVPRQLCEARPPPLSCVPCQGSCRRQAAALAPSASPASCAVRGWSERSDAWLWHGSFPGANRAGRCLMLRRRQKDPGRRLPRRQHWRSTGGQTRGPQRAGGLTGKRSIRVRWAWQHREWRAAHELAPAAPPRQLLQNIGTHYPHELHPRKNPLQPSQRIDAVPRAEHRLDRRRHDAPPVGDNAHRGQSIPEITHAIARLQYIARRDH